MDVARLFELQKLDLNMEKSRRRLAQIKQALGESEALKAARATVEATETQLNQWQTAQKNAELEAQTLATQIQDNERELMSGRVRSPKELESLQAKVESLRRHRSTIEDGGMEALLQTEMVTKNLDEQQQALREVEDAWKSGQADLVQEETRLKRIYVQLRQQREATAQAIDSDSLAYYDQLRGRKAGIAVAPVHNSQCGVCHILVPTGVVSAVRTRSNEAVLCPSCGRILFAG